MKTVLIVEDTQDYSDALKATLTHKGYNVLTAASGQEGLEKALRNKPDLVLMDVMMPDQDGPETALMFKAQASLVDIPIVFLSALTSDKAPGDNVIIVQGRAYPTISKMLDQAEIVRKIGQYVYEA